MSEGKILRACCVCDLVINEEGILVPKSSINLNIYKLSHTFLSQECFDKYVDVVTKNYDQLPKQCKFGEKYEV